MPTLKLASGSYKNISVGIDKFVSESVNKSEIFTLLGELLYVIEKVLSCIDNLASISPDVS